VPVRVRVPVPVPLMSSSNASDSAAAAASASSDATSKTNTRSHRLRPVPSLLEAAPANSQLKRKRPSTQTLYDSSAIAGQFKASRTTTHKDHDSDHEDSQKDGSTTTATTVTSTAAAGSGGRKSRQLLDQPPRIPTSPRLASDPQLNQVFEPTSDRVSDFKTDPAIRSSALLSSPDLKSKEELTMECFSSSSLLEMYQHAEQHGERSPTASSPGGAAAASAAATTSADTSTDAAAVASLIHTNNSRHSVDTTDSSGESNSAVMDQNERMTAEEFDAINIPSTLATSQAAPLVPMQVPRLIGASIEEEYDLEELEELYKVMRERETRYQPSIHCLDNHPQLNYMMRAVLVDWMCEVSKEYELSRETLHMAVNYVDRFLASESNVAREKFQLVGVTALFVASKIDEISPPRVGDFELCTDRAFMVHDIFQMEIKLLKTLNWQLLPTTSFSALRFFCKSIASQIKMNVSEDSTDEAIQEANGKIDQAMLVDTFMRNMELLDAATHDLNVLNFPPTLLAASSLCITVPELKPLLARACDYDLDSQPVRECIAFMSHFKHFPHYPLQFPSKSCIEVSADDLYAQQTHNGDTLTLFRELISSIQAK
jgi:Cyclin, N-terminal domain